MDGMKWMEEWKGVKLNWVLDEGMGYTGDFVCGVNSVP